jgi:transposase
MPCKRNLKLINKRSREAKRLFEEGKTICKIAKELNISWQTAQRDINREINEQLLEIKTKRRTNKSNWYNISVRKLTIEEAREIRALRENGALYKDLLNKYSITKTGLISIVQGKHYCE